MGSVVVEAEEDRVDQEDRDKDRDSRGIRFCREDRDRDQGQDRAEEGIPSRMGYQVVG